MILVINSESILDGLRRAWSSLFSFEKSFNHYMKRRLACISV